MNIGIDPSKVVITKLHLDPDRKQLLERKNQSTARPLRRMSAWLLWIELFDEQ